LRAKLLDQLNGITDATVKFSRFEKTTYKKKNGEDGFRLEIVHEDFNLEEIADFIEGILPSILHHRNQLRHYWSTINILRDNTQGVFIDIDFSEKLKVPTKEQAQSQHWNEKTVIVHSGIMKYEGVKGYHAYLSDDSYQDQDFVNEVLQKMIEECELQPEQTLVIESDNCSSQYKSCAHFDGLIKLATQHNIRIIRVYGVAGHGKGEVDHVGGLAKVAIRRETAAGQTLQNAEEMVECLIEKFGSSEYPMYYFKEIKTTDLDEARERSQRTVYHTVDGSSKFQVLVVDPGSNSIKAANRICTCQKCLADYGSCSSFQEYEIQVSTFQPKTLRSQFNPPMAKSGEERDDIDEIIYEDAVIAVAADDKSADTVWFVCITSKEETSDKIQIDGYGNKVPACQPYIAGVYLERSKHPNVYQKAKKNPFVDATPTKRGYLIPDTKLCEILKYVDANKLNSIF
jgi:hypothetical protein